MDAQVDANDRRPKGLLRVLRPIEAITMTGFALAVLVVTNLGHRRFEPIFGDTTRIALQPFNWLIPCFLLGHLLRLAGVARPIVRYYYWIYFVFLALIYFGGIVRLSAVDPSVRVSALLAADHALGTLNYVLGGLAATTTLVVLLLRRRRTLALLRREGLMALRAARLAFCLLLCFVAYSNLKAIIPILHPGLHDALLYRLDIALCLGRDPFRWLNELPGRWLPELMIQSYMFFFFLVLYGLAGTLLLSKSSRRFESVVTAFIVAYGIGIIGYFLLPAVGPAFAAETAGLFEPTHDFVIKRILLAMYLQFLSDPQNAPVIPFNGLASMPSLHVAHTVLALYYLWAAERRLVVVLLVPFVLLVISTVYLGMHYIVDLPVGVLVAWLGIVITRRIDQYRVRPGR